VWALGTLGIEERTARQTIARASASGWLVAHRQGREVAWSLSPKLERIYSAGSVRVFSLSDPFDTWDGTWLILLATVPHSLRNTRRPLYAGLGWAGFGNPAPGVWLTPHTERAEEVRNLIDTLGLADHTISFAGPVQSVGIVESEIVARGWALERLREHYLDLRERLSGFAPAPGEAALAAHIRMIEDYRVLPRMDPQLPDALLPDWIGRDVARRIEHLRKRWRPSVRALFEETNRAAGPRS